jgi:murein DD-endopeptidase MepM/ murein hydrolase activator NlpD
MTRTLRRLAALAVPVLLALPLLAPRLSAGAKFDREAALTRGHELTAFIVNNQPGPLWALFAPPMAEALGDSARFAATLSAIQGLTGRVDSVLDERTTEENGALVYRADCRFAKQKDPWTVSIAFDDRARIIGMFVRPSANATPTAYDSPHLDYVVRTPLHLPFGGEWTVFWGGRTIEQNYHARARDQRFALDLLMTRDGRSHSGDGAELEDYYCYGQPVLAPAAGKVVWLQDSLPDNRPGRTDPRHPTGNAVILDHGHDEYSLLAHLQPRTLEVRLGQRVRTGDVIGLCGNSGNTTEPHLHYHLQDGPRFGDADGLPPRFLDLYVDGVYADTAEIVKGQKVRPAK